MSVMNNSIKHPCWDSSAKNSANQVNKLVSFLACAMIYILTVMIGIGRRSFFVIGMISMFNLSALAQYDDSPGVVYSNWYVGQICRMTGEGASITQSFSLVPLMLMLNSNRYYNLRAAQDYMRFSNLEENTKNITSIKYLSTHSNHALTI